MRLAEPEFVTVQLLLPPSETPLVERLLSVRTCSSGSTPMSTGAQPSIRPALPRSTRFAEPSSVTAQPLGPRSETPFVERLRCNGPHLSIEANRLDQSVVIPHVTPEVLQRLHFTADHIEWLHRLGTHSAMAVLIRVPESVRAALILVSSGRSYDFDDLKLAEELGERVGTVLNNARLYRQATEALRARDEFEALAAHELRTPLTSLRISCEYLLAQTVALGAGAIRAPAERILRQSRRLSRLVNRMLDASLAERRLPPIYPQEVDLVRLIHEVVDELATNKAHAHLELALPPEAVGRWDGDRLQQVIGNLIDNALKYGRGLPVHVTLTVGAKDVTLTIADQGIGIEPALLPQLFEPYERGASSRDYGGLGLGLFVARQLVAAHGGTLTARSQVGVGSQFTVVLPRAPS
jgi:signal transduction histidine kinase